MLKREYEKVRNGLSANINTLILQRAELDQRFRESCNHPVDSLRIKTNHYDDEYGSPCPSWTDYTYSCSRCNTTIPEVKQIFKEMIPLREAITQHILKK